MKLQAIDSSYCRSKKFFGDDGSQNTFVYQSKLGTLNDYVLSWKSKRVYNLSYYILISCLE